MDDYLKSCVPLSAIHHAFAYLENLKNALIFQSQPALPGTLGKSPIPELVQPQMQQKEPAASMSITFFSDASRAPRLRQVELASSNVIA